MLQFPSPYDKTPPEKIKIVRPSPDSLDSTIANRCIGSLIGLAIGDALGAGVEFCSREDLVKKPVEDMKTGGTWNLKAGQWTDDTSMSLCLASSLITQKDFNLYDQMVRYKWWYKHGFLSSTGRCFDIGNATRMSLEEFQRRQNVLKKDRKLRVDLEVDQLPLDVIKKHKFDVFCGSPGSAGNGGLMRLAPVPLFFYQVPTLAVEYSGQSARLTHGDVRAVDACRYYGALIAAVVRGESKEQLLNDKFYDDHKLWFGTKPLDASIMEVASGSYKQPKGYDDGIRGGGFVVQSLRAALWAFWSTETFEDGVINAVNLGSDTDTTAAIYGQLAGAYYGYSSIPEKWIKKLYARDLIVCIAEWLQALSYSKNVETASSQGASATQMEPNDELERFDDN
ncbi:unnamed protein product [Adineta ricciae]|uniref:ADP-ribosylglycohydrolase n=3 Tax=Adineta ricciae TaxID=249248 RepID=A0A814IUW2_ADIRI|nr:unnamed protein product [Adineta ricciae]CAF1640092.1 unnamed protein product [Adineta ricciae]